MRHRRRLAKWPTFLGKSRPNPCPYHQGISKTGALNHSATVSRQKISCLAHFLLLTTCTYVYIMTIGTPSSPSRRRSPEFIEGAFRRKPDEGRSLKIHPFTFIRIHSRLTERHPQRRSCARPAKHRISVGRARPLQWHPSRWSAPISGLLLRVRISASDFEFGCGRVLSHYVTIT